MRRTILTAIVAAAIALPSAITNVNAAPIVPEELNLSEPTIHLIGGGRQRESLSDHNAKFGHFGHFGHYPRLHFNFTIRSGHVYFRGHRGFRHPRRGYVFYHGYYFPRFVVHPRAVKPRIIHPKPVIRLSASHVRWCYQRYKTYRHSDNTYAYKVGKRTYCRSPFSH